MKSIAFFAMLGVFPLACLRKSEESSLPGATCSQHPALPVHSAGHVRILASIFAADRKAKRSTFGFSPPDSSKIALVTDPKMCASADSALYSALIKMGGTKSVAPAEKSELYLYRTGSLYVVTDVDQSRVIQMT